MPLVKRRFYVNCNHDECIEIIQRISEKLPSIDTVEYEVREDGMLIEMYGYSTDIKKAWAVIKEYFKHSRRPAGKSVVKYSLKALARQAGKTFPPAVLVKVLSLKGFKAHYSSIDEAIQTNAGLDILMDLINQIDVAVAMVRDKVKGTAGKYYLTTLMVATGLGLEEVVNESLKLGHLRINEESGLLSLAVEWDKGVDEFIKKYRVSTS
uniref:DUF2067 domain-containing protein n=1 Tax=Thermosphaera aggregans TaxID=54254 RepID=A0A7C2BK91_9CREN